MVFFYVNKEWEKAVILTFGRHSRTTDAGFKLFIPFVETIRKVDMRLRTMDIEKQEVITKDNISVKIDTVVFYKVDDINKAILKVFNFKANVHQQALAVLRDIVGEHTLDELLAEREKVATEIKTSVDKKTDEWGIDIDQVKLQNIELPGDMKRVMARQAEAEREGKAVIVKAEAELQASTKLSKAASVLAKSPGSLQLRMMSTISDVSQDRSNTILFALPTDVMVGKGVELAAAGMSKLAAEFPEDLPDPEVKRVKGKKYKAERVN